MSKDKNSAIRRSLALIGWLVLTFSASATAVFVKTGGWYAGLAKPAWNPPDWIFGPVWTALYIMMAVAAWLVWQRGGWKAQRWPLTLYLVQWALNALWTPLFFGLQHPGLAFAGILLLLVAILATLAAFWRVRRPAGLLLIPYTLWANLRHRAELNALANERINRYWRFGGPPGVFQDLSLMTPLMNRHA